MKHLPTTHTLAVAATLWLGACSTHSNAPLFDNLGSHQFVVTTQDSPSKGSLAQRYFDQGLTLAYGFNHDEAVRSFQAAADLDPSCAMAWWGVAWALGPNINMPMGTEPGERAFAAIQRAQAACGSATPLEQGLIAALATRYENPPPADRKHLDVRYADSMRKLWGQYPREAEVGTLFADAMLNLRPWSQWTPAGEPEEGTLECLAALEAAMQLNSRHPGANHFYVHAMEASKTPEKAVPAADRLRDLVPGCGHLVHMPAHIYVQVGRFQDSIECNEKAVAADRAYFRRVGEQGIYHGYYVHNQHFLAYSAMFQGRFEQALRACRELLEELPEPFHADPSMAEFLPMACHVFVRFGRWADVLKEPSPRADQPYATAMWHYARGMALANTDRHEAARQEIAAFEADAAKVPKDQLVFIVPAHDVFKVARSMLAGEVAFREGAYEEAFRHLRQAVRHEDALRYSEPSPWMQPARHALGALLLQRNRIAEAEQVYRDDLRVRPGNGWALHGLAECLERGGKAAEARAVRSEFEKAWANATVEIKASCFCRRF